MPDKVIIPPAYRDDMRWVREHSAELYRQYEDQWVAVVDQQVVAAAPGLGQAKKVAAKRTGRQPEEIYVEFIGSASAIYGGRGVVRS